MSQGACPMGSAGPREPGFAYDYKADPRIARDLWGLAADMADRPEIFWTEANGGHWVVTSAAAMEAALLDTAVFSSRTQSIPPPPERPTLIPTSLDPPAHTPYRKVMAQKMFSARALAGIEEEARAMARALVDAFADKGRCEFVEEFARRLPVDLFLRLMGAPPERREAFLAWVEKVFRAASAEEMGQGFVEANAFVAQWLDEQMASKANQGRLYLAMAQAEIDGRPLTRDEMHAMTMMLFLGGLDTVLSQLTHIFRFLAESPAHRRRLVEAPQLIPAAMEELLRRFGIANFVREVAEDTRFRGAELKAGDLVLFATPFANLDRRAFDDPLTVDFERAAKVRHWGFGHGVHLCVGAHLARVEIRAALEEVLPRLPGLSVEPGCDLTIRSGGTFVLEALPLRWEVG